MKKVILFFICGLILSFSAFAQNSLTANHTHLFRYAEKTLIKSHTFPNTVSCYNSDTSATFVYSGSGMQVTEINIDSIFVNDLVVAGDSVFFCGKNIKTNRGIIGYFSINSFFTYPSRLYLDTLFLAGEAGKVVKELTRMVTYKDPMDITHIIAVGTCDDNDYPCLVDLHLGLNSPFYWAGFISDRNETFTDVKIFKDRDDKDHLVTTGYYKLNGTLDYINIRAYNMDFIFMPTGPQNRRHSYYMNYVLVDPWLDGGILLADGNSNIFSTISYRIIRMPEEIRDANIIHLGFYDLDAIIANSVYSMVDNYDIPISNTESREMNQFIYNSKKKKLLFLHTFVTAFSGILSSEYCEVEPSLLTTTGNLQAYTNPDTRQSGLDNYWSNNYYILSGYDILDPRVSKYQMNKYGMPAECATPKSYKYFKREPLESVITYKEFDYQMQPIRDYIVFRNKSEKPLFIECEK